MENKKYYIVYQITNLINNYIYIGCHSTYNVNDSYIGSGTNILKAIKKYGKKNFNKEVLFIFNNKEDMLLKEKQLVNKEFISRKDTYNIILGGSTFLTIDNISVKDKNGNMLMVHKNDERYLSGELVGVVKNKVVVKDKNNNKIQVDINDPRYISGELKHINNNKIIVKDKNNNKLQVDINDPRYISGELTGHTKNLSPMMNLLTNKVELIDTRNYNKNNYISINKNKKCVINEKNEIIQVDKSDNRFKHINKDIIYAYDENYNIIRINKNHSKLYDSTYLCKNYRKIALVKDINGNIFIINKIDLRYKNELKSFIKRN